MSLLDTALMYSKAGLSIIPTAKSKRPVISQWKSYQQQPAGELTIKEWFKDLKPEAVAIITGQVSGFLEMIDFDYHPERPDVPTRWRKMVEEEAPGLLERLVLEQTPRGGYHCVYSCPEVQIPGNQILAQFIPEKDPDAAGKPKAIIETRGEGGYFLCAPSPGYKLVKGNLAGIPAIRAEDRAVLMKCAKLLNEYVHTTEPYRGDSAEHRNDSTDTPWGDFNNRANVGELLARNGWTLISGANGLYEYYKRPGKKGRGHSASLIDGKVFHNFSSNAHPFEPHKSYTPFAVYALLEHAGDFKAAARALKSEGYGKAKKRTCRPRQPEPPPPPEQKTVEFPLNVMAGAAADFTELYSSCLEPPAEFFYFSFLTCLGSVLAKRLTLESQVAPQPRLYTILLGQSADDRKSTAAKETVDFFRDSIEEGFNVCYGVGSAEGLQKRHEENDNVVLFLDEFKQFVSKCKIEASVLLPCVNTLFESNRYESRTKKTDIRLNSAYLSILAASTIDTYANTWSAQFTDIGFNNRVWIVPASGERRFSIPPKLPDRDKYFIKQKLAEVLRHVGEWRELSITSEGQRLFHEWYMDLESSVHTRRLDGYALRLMPLLAVNELKDEIESDVVSKVIALANWQLQVRRLHDPIDAETNIAKMEEKIRRVLRAKGALDARELKQQTNANRSGLWIWDQAMRNLAKCREVVYHRKHRIYYLSEVAT